MKTHSIVLGVLGVLSFACGADSQGVESDDDASVEAGTGGGQPHDGGNTAGPSFVTFGTNVTELTEGETLRFTAVLTDADGIEDLVGGALLSDDGAVPYGAFQSSAEEGAYHLDLSWAEINTVSTIALATGSVSSRGFRAQFFDQAGTLTEATTAVDLHCDGVGACEGICQHSHEPNETESTARDLGKIDDCDSSGAADDVVFEGDEDWYTYEADDTLGCINFGDTLSWQATSDGDMNMCAFVDCDDASCLNGSVPATSPEGRPGCCAVGESLLVKTGCGSFWEDNSTRVFLRVTSKSATCTSYTVNYTFD